jgi:hypothetical protein
MSPRYHLSANNAQTETLAGRLYVRAFEALSPLPVAIATRTGQSKATFAGFN